jgi:hypothetical protein
MTTKELIKSEIDSIGDEDLDELYRLVKEFVQSRTSGKNGSLMARLRNIQIDAPADFAANLDLYVSGEKGDETDLR